VEPPPTRRDRRAITLPEHQKTKIKTRRNDDHALFVDLGLSSARGDGRIGAAASSSLDSDKASHVGHAIAVELETPLESVFDPVAQW
jgi:hypothetical protein